MTMIVIYIFDNNKSVYVFVTLKLDLYVSLMIFYHLIMWTMITYNDILMATKFNAQFVGMCIVR
mgnify:CR=1 FL=1